MPDKWIKRITLTAVFSLLFAFSADAEAATHYPDGAKCYDCHAVRQELIIPGTHLIKMSARTWDLGMTATDNAVRCVFCHDSTAVATTSAVEQGQTPKMRGVREHFDSNVMSGHRVAIEKSGFITDSSYFDCMDCHNVSGVASDSNGNATVHGVDASSGTSLDVRRKTLRGINPDSLLGPVDDAELSRDLCYGYCHDADGQIVVSGLHEAKPAHPADPAKISLNDSAVGGGGSFISVPANPPSVPSNVMSINCVSCHASHGSAESPALLTLLNTSGNNGDDTQTGAPTNAVVQLDECDVCHMQDENDSLTDNFYDFGHGKMGLTCQSCHELLHDSDGDGLFDAAPRLKANLVEEKSFGKGQIDVSGVPVTSPYFFYSNCRKCHAGHLRHTPSQIATDGGPGFQQSNFYIPQPGDEGSDVGCLDCHDQHGTTAADSAYQNDTMIRRQLGPTGNKEDARLPDDDNKYSGDWFFHPDSGASPCSGGDDCGLCDNNACHTAIPDGKMLYDPSASGKDYLPVASNPPDPVNPHINNDSLISCGDGEGCHVHLGGPLNSGSCTSGTGCHMQHLSADDFFAEGKQCNECHGYPPLPPEGLGYPPPYDTLEDNPDAVGVHATHAIDIGYGCYECHYYDTDAVPPPATGAKHNQSKWNTNQGFIDQNFLDVDFNPARNPDGSYNPDTNTCSNLTCHNPDDAVIGLTGKGDPTQTLRSAPQWLTDYRTTSAETGPNTDPSGRNLGTWEIGDSGEEGCEACHLNSLKTNPDGGSHYAHESPEWPQKNYACRACHGGVDGSEYAMDSSANIYPKKHANLEKWDETANRSFIEFNLANIGGTFATDPDFLDAWKTSGDYTYAVDSGMAGVCTTVYCHGGIGYNLPSADGSNGTNKTPVWNDYSTGNCNTCHAAMGDASNRSGNDPDVKKAKEISTGKHANHYLDTNGPLLPPMHAGSGCNQCHNIIPVGDDAPENCYTYCHINYTEGALGVGATAPSIADDGSATPPVTHVDGKIDFGDPFDPATITKFDPTSMCDGCHGNEAGAAPNENIQRQLAKHFWYDAGSWLDSTEAINVLLPGTSDARTAGGTTYCLNCHQGTVSVVPVFDDVQDLWIDATAQAEAYYLTTGHGNAGSYNATLHGQTGPGYECRVCHDATQSHIDLTPGNDLRLKTVTESPALAYTSAQSELCLDCHKPGQSAAGQLGYDATAEASVHSGGVTGNYATPASAPGANGAYGDSTDNFATNQGYQCNACHDAHGTTKLAMIIDTLDGGFGGVSNPQTVIGLESSDPDMSDLDPTTGPDDGTCDLCHAAAGQSHPDTAHNGADSHYQGGNGNSCVNISCHEHSQSFKNNVQTCIDCHGDGGSAEQIAWQGASAVGKTTNYGSHLRAAAGEDLTLVADWNAQCKKCHPAAGHVGGDATAPAPPQSSTHAGLPNGTNMRQRLGIDYPEGIQLGGTATSGKTSEAEICWDCHGAGQANDQINEWGFNTDTNGSYPVVDLALDGGVPAGQNSQNQGWLYADGSWSVETYDWTGTDGSGAYRKDAYQHQDYDGGTTTPLSQKIVSVHSANFAAAAGCTADPNDVDCASSVENNVDATGAVTRSAATKLEARSAIRCSYCHDVHDLNKADINNDGTPDDPSNGPPHLRHAWMGNPYPPDMPPVASYAYPMTGGPFNTGSRYFSAGQDGIAGNVDDAQFSEAVPRLWADSATSGKGGYWIDANSGRPTDDPSYDQLEEEGGLCVLCHGTDVDNMDYWTTTSLWRADQTNGHSNAALGGTGSGKADLFTGRRGSSLYDFMGHQEGVSVADYGTKTEGGNLINAISPFAGDFNGATPAISTGVGGASSPPRNNGWYGGTAGSTTKDAQYLAWYHYFGQTIGTDGTGGSGYPHQFTCSKCHSPHASSLPALLTTNCLDQGKATWTGASGGATPSGKQAMNCHRKESTATGWHRLAPGQ